MPELHPLGRDEPGHQQHRPDDHGLDGDQDLSLVETIEQRSGDRAGDQDRRGLSEADQAEFQLVIGDLVDEIAHRGNPDPDTGQRKADRDPEAPEHRGAQGAERSVLLLGTPFREPIGFRRCLDRLVV